MRLLLTLASTSLFLTGPASAELVVVLYEAEVTTVVGQPFGMEVPRLSVVRGHFTYDPGSQDAAPDDPRRGKFEPVQSWGFLAEFLDQTVTGSVGAKASIETYGYTLRFDDGGDSPDTGDMALGGAPRTDIELALSFTGSSQNLPTDQLPEHFDFAGAPHTFSLGDDSGHVLIQFRNLTQLFPIAIKSFAWDDDEIQLTWHSTAGRHCGVDFTTDREEWLVLQPLVVGAGSETSITDDLRQRYAPGEDLPQQGFYRVRDLGSWP